MGDMADAMINGDFDFHTGEYIGRGGGYPRTKNKTLSWEGRRRGQRFTREVFTDEEKMAGVIKWMHDKGVTTQENRINILREYVSEHIPELGKNKWVMRSCVIIQSNFPSFIEWFNKKQNA